jgi:hypothetical protein
MTICAHFIEVHVVHFYSITLFFGENKNQYELLSLFQHHVVFVAPKSKSSSCLFFNTMLCL